MFDVRVSVYRSSGETVLDRSCVGYVDEVGVVLVERTDKQKWILRM